MKHLIKNTAKFWCKGLIISFGDRIDLGLNLFGIELELSFNQIFQSDLVIRIVMTKLIKLFPDLIEIFEKRMKVVDNDFSDL